MSAEHLPYPDTVRGGRDSEPRPWGRRRTLLAVAVAAVIAVLGGAAIYAASGRSSPQLGGPPPGHHADGPAGRPPFGPGGPRPQQEMPLHGQVVVADGAGGFVTMLSQTGVVTATTPGSITVRSADGFTQTWSTAPGEDPAFAVDDSVMVRGVQNGMTAEVTEVLDPLRGRR
ncbi:hypothetical protein [Mycobacterium sp. ZZG]